MSFDPKIVSSKLESVKTTTSRSSTGAYFFSSFFEDPEDFLPPVLPFMRALTSD